MMLFKISLKNIRKSIRDYAIYFFTLIVGVAIFYIFNAVEKQTIMLNLTGEQKEIIKVLVQMLSGVSVFVSFVLGFLIIYASRFLIKRRNKEFGIYLMLGMGKRKISIILFIETLLIGMISLVVGLLVGTMFSQLMSIFIANTFEADMTRFEFVFSGDACVRTVTYFGIMYVIVMIFNVFVIGKCKLIDLMQAGRKSEKLKIKNPIICTIVFIISAAMLGYAYYLVTGGFTKLNKADKILIPIGLGAISTFLIFWSVSGLLLKLAMLYKTRYYKGLNSFMIRQISSKINTTVFSMTIICLMLFITICVMSVATSIKESFEKGMIKYCKADIQMIKSNTDSDMQKGIIEIYKKYGYDITEYFKEYIIFYQYTETNTAAESNISFIGQGIFLPEMVISVSDYNKIADMYGNKTYTLKDDEYMVVANWEYAVSVLNDSLKDNPQIQFNGFDLKPKYASCVDGFIDISVAANNTGFFVVSDSVLNGCKPICDILLANYAGDTKEEKRATEDKIIHMDVDGYDYVYATKTQAYDETVGIGIMFTFIGLYIGIIFLISCAAILALKELSESADNVERYRILRKIGADEKMINKALFGQIGIFFGIPLLLACIHSVFGIKFGIYITSIFGTDGLLPAILFTTTVLVGIYGGYFILTYICSKSIIKSRN